METLKKIIEFIRKILGIINGPDPVSTPSPAANLDEALKVEADAKKKAEDAAAAAKLQGNKEDVFGSEAYKHE